MKRYLDIIEKRLHEALLSVPEPALAAAMRHGVASGGKRIRPIVALAAAEAAGGRAEDAAFVASAIELLHNYTLIHDDLPAMDNDSTRRGRPSVWAAFGEANAILAGDALQALAFAETAKSPGDTAKILAAFAEAGVGVVAGQVEDIAANAGNAPGDKEKTLEFVFTHKTADLFVCAAKAGALAASASSENVEKLARFALHLGLAFQYEDDLIDGDDGAFSSLSFLSRDEVARRAAMESDAAIAALEGLPGNTDFLASLARRLATRKI